MSKDIRNNVFLQMGVIKAGINTYTDEEIDKKFVTRQDAYTICNNMYNHIYNSSMHLDYYYRVEYNQKIGRENLIDTVEEVEYESKNGNYSNPKVLKLDSEILEHYKNRVDAVNTNIINGISDSLEKLSEGEITIPRDSVSVMDLVSYVTLILYGVFAKEPPVEEEDDTEYKYNYTNYKNIFGNNNSMSISTNLNSEPLSLYSNYYIGWTVDKNYDRLKIISQSTEDGLIFIGCNTCSIPSSYIASVTQPIYSANDNPEDNCLYIASNGTLKASKDKNYYREITVSMRPNYAKPTVFKLFGWDIIAGVSITSTSVDNRLCLQRIFNYNNTDTEFDFSAAKNYYTSGTGGLVALFNGRLHMFNYNPVGETSAHRSVGFKYDKDSNVFSLDFSTDKVEEKQLKNISESDYGNCSLYSTGDAMIYSLPLSTNSDMNYACLYYVDSKGNEQKIDYTIPTQKWTGIKPFLFLFRDEDDSDCIHILRCATNNDDDNENARTSIIFHDVYNTKLNKSVSSNIISEENASLLDIDWSRTTGAYMGEHKIFLLYMRRDNNPYFDYRYGIFDVKDYSLTPFTAGIQNLVFPYCTTDTNGELHAIDKKYHYYTDNGEWVLDKYYSPYGKVSASVSSYYPYFNQSTVLDDKICFYSTAMESYSDKYVYVYNTNKNVSESKRWQRYWVTAENRVYSVGAVDGDFYVRVPNGTFKLDKDDTTKLTKVLSTTNYLIPNNLYLLGKNYQYYFDTETNKFILGIYHYLIDEFEIVSETDIIKSDDNIVKSLFFKGKLYFFTEHNSLTHQDRFFIYDFSCGHWGCSKKLCKADSNSNYSSVAAYKDSIIAMSCRNASTNKYFNKEPYTGSVLQIYYTGGEENV